MHIWTFRELFSSLLRHWLKVVVVFLLSVATMMALALTAEPIYEAEAVFLVKLGRAYIYRPEVSDDSTGSRRDTEAVINAELALLRSIDFGKRVVSEFGVDRLMPVLAGSGAEPKLIEQRAGKRFLRSFSARGVANSDMIKVSYRHTDPEVTEEIVSLALDVFKEQHLKAFSDPQAAAFLEEKVEEYRVELKDAEEALKAFQQRGYTPTEMLYRERAELGSAIKTAGNELVGLRRKLTYLRGLRDQPGGIDEVDGQAYETRAVDNARSQLLNLRLKEAELLATRNDSSREVQDVRRQIGVVESFIADLEESSAGGYINMQLETQIFNTLSEVSFEEARLQGLTQQLRELDQELAESVRKEEQLRSLGRDREIAERNFETYAQRLEEARVSDEMDQQKIANISVLEAPTLPLKPVAPNKKLYLAIGVLLGAGLGVGTALAADFLRSVNPRRASRQRVL